MNEMELELFRSLIGDIGRVLQAVHVTNWTPDALCVDDIGSGRPAGPKNRSERPQKTAAAEQRAGLQQRPTLSDMFRSRAVRSDRGVCIQPSVGAC